MHRYRIVKSGGRKGKQYFRSAGSFGDKKLAKKEAERIRRLRRQSGISYKSVRVEKYRVV